MSAVEPEPLTIEQARMVMNAFQTYCRLKGTHEARLSDEARAFLVGPMQPDIWHSALLFRLLGGGEPLSEPPALIHSYPAYPDDPWEGRR